MLIFFHIRLGVDFALNDTNESELARLTRALHVPSTYELLDAFTSDTVFGDTMRTLASGWIHHLVVSASLPGSNALKMKLSHPAIFELVGLPKNYDTLTDEAIRRKCPTTGKELSDPNICLFCGEIFCSQAVCCMKDESDGKGGKTRIGGCAQHLKKFVSLSFQLY